MTHDSHSLPAKAGSHKTIGDVWLPPSGGRLRKAIHRLTTVAASRRVTQKPFVMREPVAREHPARIEPAFRGEELDDPRMAGQHLPGVAQR